MLYDPKWEINTGTPFSLENLIAWMETKNPAEEYNFHLHGNCVLAQWVKSIDPAIDDMAGRHSFEYLVNGQMVDLSHLKRVACNAPGAWTFGAALDRARAMAAKANRSHHEHQW